MGNLTGSASAEIDAPIEAVWSIVEDVASAPDWQGGMDSLTPLETDAQGRPTLVETETDAKVRRIKTKVRFSYDGPHRLSWTQEKGDLKSVNGTWELEQIDGERTRATYSLEVDPGRMLGALVRGPLESTLRDLLVNGRPQELKQRVETG
ncbi:MAG: hypothetical protein NVSMB51_19490 [Solirubrobacteraceae bacterium]